MRQAGRGPDPGRATGRVVLWLILACMLLPFVLGGVVLLYGSYGPGHLDHIIGPFIAPAPVNSTTPLARGIRFVGVQPEGSDDVLDAYGNKVGEMPCMEGRTHFGGNHLRRTFLFELPETDGPVLFPKDARILRLQQGGRSFGGSGEGRQVEYEGRRLYVHTASFPGYTYESGPFSSERVDVQRVDLWLRFYHGPRRGARFRFDGPFAVGRTHQSVGIAPGTLTVLPPRRPGEVCFRFVTGARLGPSGLSGDESQWLVYDTAGRRLMPSMSHSGSLGSSGANLTCRFTGTPLEQVASIVCGEQAQQRTFRNVRVRYPNRADAKYPEDVHKMAKALGHQPAEVMSKRIGTVDEALAVVDLARGARIEWLRGPLSNLKFAELPAEKQRKLLAAATRWARMPMSRTREIGVELGMRWSGGAEFAEAALAMLDSDESYARSRGASLLSRSDSLTAPQIERIKQRLLARRDRQVAPSLFETLRRSKDPAAAKALRALADTPDDRAELWRRAVMTMSSRGELKDRAKLPRKLRVRWATLATPRGEDKTVLAEARALLARLLTPRLALADASAFEAVRRDVVARLDAPAATKAFVDFLRGLGPGNLAADDGQRQVWRIVKHVNLWHATDFGSFGWDARRVQSWKGGQMAGHDWRGIVRSVVRWYDAGNGRQPDTAPAAPRPGVKVVGRTLVSSELPYIDLETGRLLGLPAELRRVGGRYKRYKELNEAREAWRDENGIDAKAYAGAGRAHLTCWMAFSPVPARYWSTADAPAIHKALSRSVKRADLDTGHLGPLPATVAFGTSDGRNGVLQIVATESGKGVTVRYWLLAGAAPAGK